MADFLEDFLLCHKALLSLGNILNKFSSPANPLLLFTACPSVLRKERDTVPYGSQDYSSKLQECCRTILVSKRHNKALINASIFATHKT